MPVRKLWWRTMMRLWTAKLLLMPMESFPLRHFLIEFGVQIIYIYVCIYIYMRVYIHMYMWIYIYIYVFVYIYVYNFKYIYIVYTGSTYVLVQNPLAPTILWTYCFLPVAQESQAPAVCISEGGNGARILSITGKSGLSSLYHNQGIWWWVCYIPCVQQNHLGAFRGPNQHTCKLAV